MEVKHKNTKVLSFKTIQPPLLPQHGHVGSYKQAATNFGLNKAVKQFKQNEGH